MIKNTKNLAKMKAGKDAKLAKDFGSPWQIIVATIAIFIVSQLVAAFLVELVEAFIHSGANSGSALNNSAPAQFFYILLAEGGAAWLVLKWIRRRGLTPAQIGLGRRPMRKDVMSAALGFAVFFVILIVVNGILSAIFPSLNGEQQDIGFNYLNSSLDHALALLALVLLPPLGEEILVRGYLYSGLRSRLKYLPAMLVTSLIFGLAHLELGNGAAVVWAAGIDTFTLSIILVYLRETTGALYAGMLVHGLNNLIAYSVHFH